MPSGAADWKGIHAPIVSEALDIEGSTQANFAYNSSAQVSNTLAEGYYALWASTDCYLAISANNAVANAVASNTGLLLYANNMVIFKVRASRIIGAIQRTVSGTLSYVKVG